MEKESANFYSAIKIVVLERKYCKDNLSFSTFFPGIRVFMQGNPIIFYCCGMDKKAVMYAVGAMIIILIVALVVKPIATGQPLNLGLPKATTPYPTYPVTTPDASGMSVVVIPATSAITRPPTPVPYGTKIS